uniref:Uncharacterized protein n=1 Tax=Anguilla anguilla TaxID=7936 RepID=A0A0E9SZZ7_ANGAN
MHHFVDGKIGFYISHGTMELLIHCRKMLTVK